MSQSEKRLYSKHFVSYSRILLSYRKTSKNKKTGSTLPPVSGYKKGFCPPESHPGKAKA